MPAWTAETEIDASLAERLIGAQFPALAPVRATLLGTGWDNAAFVVNRTRVFRFPRRQVAAALIETEATVLPILAPLLPLPIPAPRWVGAPTGDFPWPFSGYPLLAGKTLCRAQIDDDARRRLAAPLGAFLKALHAATVAPGLLPPDTIRRLDLSHRLPRAREGLAVAVERGDVADPAPLAALIDDAPMDFVPRADTPVHGDLYVRHVLVDEKGAASGVIDWGDLHRGDPAIDIAVAHTILPTDCHDDFRAAYGSIDDLTWQVARLRALWHTLTVLAYAHDIGDQDLIREGRWTLATLDGAAKATR